MTSDLDRAIEDAKGRLVYAKERLPYARQLVDLKFQRGDYPMIQSMDRDTREALAVAMLKEMA
jgi:hypothetical protein